MSNSAKKKFLDKLLMEVYRPYMVEKGKSLTRAGYRYRVGSSRARDNRGIKYVVTPEAIAAYNPKINSNSVNIISNTLSSLLTRSRSKRITKDRSNPGIFYVSPRTGKSGSTGSAQEVLGRRLRAIVKMKTNDKNIELVQKYLKGNFHDEGESLIIGHTFGPGLVKSKEAQRAAALMYGIARRSPGSLAAEDLEDLKSLSMEVVKLHKEAVRIDAHLDIDASAGGPHGPFRKLDIAIPEPKMKNQEEGAAVGRLIAQERKLLDKMLQYLENAGLADLKGSNTLIEDVMQATADTFKGKKTKKKRTKGKPRSSSTVDFETPVVVSRSKKGSKKETTRQPNTLFGNLLHLQNVINLKMHDTLKQEVMGQGGDPVTLNYRTGRFARSAYVNQLIPMKGGLEAQVTWQRYPYDTFAPGGRLHTAMRDPNFLIGQSIREILKEVGLQGITISTRSQ